MFMNQVLQRAADIGRWEWAIDDRRNVTLPNGEKQLLKLTKDISLGDYNIWIESGWNMRQKQERINNAILQALSSGGIEMMEPLIAALAADNPKQVLSIFRETKDMILKSQAAAQEQAGQQAQVSAQLEQEKNRIPIEVANIQASAKLQEVQMKTQNDREKEDFKGQMGDIQEVNERERMILDGDIQARMKQLEQQAQ